MSRNIDTPPATPVVLMNRAFCANDDPLLGKAAAAWIAGGIDLDPFRLTFTWDTLAANANNTPQKNQVDSGQDFLVERIVLCAFSAPGTIVANPDYLLDLSDAAAGPWQDAPHHVMLWTGQANRTPDLTVVRYLKGGSPVTAKLTNLTPTAARVDLALAGWRISYKQSTREVVFGIAPVPR